MRWQQAQPCGRARKPCEGHTVSVVDRCLYVLFGKHEDDVGNVTCPALLMLDTETMMLSHPHFETSGADGRSGIPDDREGHSASVIGTKIYVFGGTWTDEDDNTIYMNDLHVLDVSNFSWARPVWSGTPPIEREGHTASVVGRRVFVFAGTWVDDEHNSVYLNDLHVLDTSVDAMAWTQPSTSGEAPCQREGHTASTIGDKIVIFGGAGLDKADAQARAILGAQFRRAIPTQCAAQFCERARLFSPSQVNLHDVHILDAESMQWSSPQVSGPTPQERRYHTASVVDRQIYVFGGQYYDQSADLHFECDNQLCVLDVPTLSWVPVPVEGPAPLRRACHSAAVVGRSLFMVGGRYWDVAEDDYIFLNDIQTLDTRPASTLAADWRRFLRDEQLSDVTLRVQGALVPAHRVVLAARCPFFARMFASGMREASQHEVEIEDVSLDALNALLEHLYTDAADVPSELALQLFAAADRFGVERLKSLCAAKIEAELSSASVCAVLVVADAHSAAELKQACVEYIVRNFPAMHQTDDFRELPRPLMEAVHAALSSALFGGRSSGGSGGGMAVG